MDIQDIARSKEKKAVFNMVLEEACRQWCCFIDEAPERRNGEGFSEFFYEIFEDKEKDYLVQVLELNGGKLPPLNPKCKDHER